MKKLFLIIFLFQFHIFSMRDNEGNFGQIPLAKENLYQRLRAFFAKNNKTLIFCLLKEARPKDLWCEEKSKLRILYEFSVINGWHDIFELLLQKDLYTDKNQLFQQLALRKDIDRKFLEILLKYGININHLAPNGKTLLDYVTKKNDDSMSDMKKFLIENGAL